jgi:hypothetical protein
VDSFADCAPVVFQRRNGQKNGIDDDPVEIGSVKEEGAVDEGNDEMVAMNNEDDNGDSRDHQREGLD